MRSVLVGLSLLMLICACGDAAVPTAPAAPRGDAGTKPDSGTSDKRDAGAADSGTAMALGPKVTFVFPLPARDPNTDDLITEPTLTVACKVERAARSGAAAVDKTTVKIGLKLLTEDDKEAWIEPPVNAAADDTFEAQFELGALANGPLHFRCVARDLAAMPNTTTALLDTLLDLGPKIEIEEPNKPSYALKTPTPIKFRVAASPVTDGDTEAEVDDVTLTMSGVEVEVEEDSTTPGLYQTSVDFEDRTRFPVPPQSTQVSVTATNKRSPKAAVRSAKVDFAIDGQGPTIIVREPADGQIVHGKKRLRVEVTDPSGVNASSLVANFNQGLIVIREWDRVGTEFGQDFDTSEYKTLTRLTASISATDAVGNETTVALIVKLDNLPPVISLTPPLIREWRKNGQNYECSALFDPVGDAPNDGDPLTTYGYFRVLVEDKTNQPPFGPNEPPPITYIAGLDTKKVEVFMQRDVSLPFLVDKDGDGICDEIYGRFNEDDEAQDPLPEAQRPRKITLSPIIPTGAPWYRIQDATSGDNASCYTPTTAMPPITQPTRPIEVCLKTPMHRVVPARTDGRPAAVYALNPTNSALGACTGDYWELSMIASPGWICVAARAEDTVQNIGISEPVRICFGGIDCSSMPMPTCRKDCEISPAQRFHHDEGSIQWYFP